MDGDTLAWVKILLESLSSSISNAFYEKAKELEITS